MAEPTGLEPARFAAFVPFSPNFLAIYSHQSRLLPICGDFVGTVFPDRFHCRALPPISRVNVTSAGLDVPVTHQGHDLVSRIAFLSEPRAEGVAHGVETRPFDPGKLKRPAEAVLDLLEPLAGAPTDEQILAAGLAVVECKQDFPDCRANRNLPLFVGLCSRADDVTLEVHVRAAQVEDL